MASKKYYSSEEIEFQNGDRTEARQLTIKRLRLLNEIFTDNDKRIKEQQERIEAFVAEKEEEGVSKDKAVEEMEKILEDEDHPTYLDVLISGALIALGSWRVKDIKGKTVEIDEEYIEDNLDYPTIVRINEIAGSMELGNTSESEKK